MDLVTTKGLKEYVCKVVNCCITNKAMPFVRLDSGGVNCRCEYSFRQKLNKIIVAQNNCVIFARENYKDFCGKKYYAFGLY